MDKTVVTPKFLEPLSPAWFEWRIGGAKQGAADTAIDSRPFINCVRDIKRHKAWDAYFKDEPKTWERFCQEVLRTEPAFADQVELGVEVLEQAGHFGPIPEKLALERARGGQIGNRNALKSYISASKQDNRKTNKRISLNTKRYSYIERAKKLWLKMSDEERVVFRDWIER